MSDILNPKKNFVLNIDSENDHEMIAKLSHALSVPERIKILRSLLNSSKSLSAISQELDMPVSSVARHIDVSGGGRADFHQLSARTQRAHQILLAGDFKLYGVAGGGEKFGKFQTGIFRGNAHRYVFALSHQRALRHGGKGRKNRIFRQSGRLFFPREKPGGMPVVRYRLH